MLQNSRVTAFAVSDLLRKNQQGVKLPPSPTQIGSGYNVVPCSDGWFTF